MQHAQAPQRGELILQSIYYVESSSMLTAFSEVYLLQALNFGDYHFPDGKI